MKKLLLTIIALVSFPSVQAQDDDLYATPKASSSNARTYHKEGFLELKFTDGALTEFDFRVPFENGLVQFSEVVFMEGYSAQQIYDKVRLAMTDYWRSSKDVTQLDDAVNKIIIAKGYGDWLLDKDALITRGFQVYYTIKIECRDDRYRILVYGFKSYNSTYSAYGKIEISCQEEECFKYGIKKDGSIRKDIRGLSWLAWKQVSERCIKSISDLINKADANSTADW